MQKKVIVLCFLLAIAVAFSYSSFAAVGSASLKIAPDVMEELETQDEVSVLVVFEDAKPSLKAAAMTQEEKRDMIEDNQEYVKDHFDSNQGFGISSEQKVTIEANFKEVNGLAAMVNEEGLEELVTLPEVKAVYPNRPVAISLSTSRVVVNATKTGLLMYGSMNLTGYGQTICIIDTGVDYTHAALGGCAATDNINDGSCGKVIAGYDYVNLDNNPMDDHGHGTHVAGIAASEDSTYRGIAPDAKIAAVKSLGSGGSGTTADVISGIDWCVSNRETYNISVISMSLGTTDLFDTNCEVNDTLTALAVASAVAVNMSVIAASGNDGNTERMSSPACITNVTSVGRTNNDDTMHASGNRNNLTDLLAPGSSIMSTNDGGGFTTLSGTSMSTPHVAGAFALLRQYFWQTQNQSTNQSGILNILNDTGYLVVDSGGTELQFSRINIFAAISSLDILAPDISITNPADNYISNNISFVVNVTSSESLTTAILEVNNTNVSMTGSGVAWSVNVSFLKNGSYQYRVYGNDTFNNRAVSEYQTVLIDLDQPLWGFNQTNISMQQITQYDSVQFNITANDTVALSDFIFSWNDSGLWQNVTTGVLSGLTQEVSVNQTVNSSRGKVVGYRWYANDSVNNIGESDLFAFEVFNQPPQINISTISSSDHLNRTNGTLTGVFTAFDSDTDNITMNKTKWYNGSVEIVAARNTTFIQSQNTTRNQTWNFSVRVFDGMDWSAWANTSILIQNTAPNISILNFTAEVRETQIVNVSTFSGDNDLDTVTVSMNDSRFSLTTNDLIWNPGLADQGTYTFTVIANDSIEVTRINVTILIIDSRDLDDDGNPDFNDTDDDNDNILDVADYVAGNASSINSSIAINITINNTANLTQVFNGTFFINISNGTDSLVSFFYTFSENSTFDLGKITLKVSTNGTGAISIRGVNATTVNGTKVVYVTKANASVSAVCIRDEDIGFESISSACDGATEVLVSCDNTSQSGYTCFDEGAKYKISGLNHSAVKELCVDQDNDGYGTGCALGSDGCDSDASTTGSCPAAPGGSGGGGGGGGSGGGGGGIAKAQGASITQFYSSLSGQKPQAIDVNNDDISLRSLIFTLKENKRDVMISVEETPSSTVKNPFNGTVYAYTSVDHTQIVEGDVAGATLLYAVNLSWVDKNNIDTETITVYRFDEAWDEVPTNFVRQSEGRLWFEAFSPGLSLFAIAGEEIEIVRPEPELQALDEMNVASLNENSTADPIFEEQQIAEPQNTLAIGAVIFFVVIIVSGLAGFSGYQYYQKNHHNHEKHKKHKHHHKK